MVKNAFKTKYDSLKMVRELMILSKLSKMKNNCFIAKLLDIILPYGALDDTSKLTEVFIVQEWVPYDLKSILSRDILEDYSTTHVKVIMYNLLLSVNFLHSSNIMHRDLKPANILVDD